MIRSMLAAMAAVLLLLSAPGTANSGGRSIADLNWQFGPTEVQLQGGAIFAVPEGHAFLGEADTRIMQEMMQNLPTPGETMFAPESLAWFAMFRFEDVGYVEDSEQIDAAAILTSVRDGQREANKELARRGWSTLSIDGWAHPPRYDRSSQRLEWAIQATNQAEGHKIVNYNTRVLGRRGFLKVVLVVSPEELGETVPVFKQTLLGLRFRAGEDYASYRAGDKTAQYGLAALIAGGAAAVATKGGGKGLFKAIIAGVAAVAWAVWAGAKKLFGKK
jgi:uncharacterized membrane-anchored protein